MRENDDMEACIRFDWAIKKVLRNKANFDILEGFLTVLMERPIEIVDLLESEGNARSEYEKMNRVDLLAREANGELIIVEVQNSADPHFFQRMAYGSAKAIVDHLDVGMPYSAVKKVYGVNIVRFELGMGRDWLYDGKMEFHSRNGQPDLLVGQRFVEKYGKDTPGERFFPQYYVIRINSFDRIAASPIEEWIDYLKNGRVRRGTRVPGLSAVDARLKLSDMTPDERARYLYELDEIQTFNAALADGIEEKRDKFILEGKLELVRQMLANGSTMETMAAAMHVTPAELRQMLADDEKEKAEEAQRKKDKRLDELKVVRKMLSRGSTLEEISDVLDIPVEELQRMLDPFD